MPEDLPSSVMDALRAAQARGTLPTSLGTAELRELGEEILARSVFTARGTSAVFADVLKQLVEQLAAGEMNESSVRLALLETLQALDYTPEGGFPDAPAGAVPPALQGTLQDLSSHRRLNLIIDTQRGLMVGAGQKSRGSEPTRLQLFPAWELVRQLSARVPRDWLARWAIAGGKLYQGRMIALKGDPVWGELGSYSNFPDALGVDYPPFAFSSGMGWSEIDLAECRGLSVLGPAGESLADFQASSPATLGGRQPLPAPAISIREMDPALRDQLLETTGAIDVGGTATLPAGAEGVAQRAAARDDWMAALMARDVSEAKTLYANRKP